MRPTPWNAPEKMVGTASPGIDLGSQLAGDGRGAGEAGLGVGLAMGPCPPAGLTGLGTTRLVRTRDGGEQRLLPLRVLVERPDHDPRKAAIGRVVHLRLDRAEAVVPDGLAGLVRILGAGV